MMCLGCSQTVPGCPGGSEVPGVNCKTLRGPWSHGDELSLPVPPGHLLLSPCWDPQAPGWGQLSQAAWTTDTELLPLSKYLLRWSFSTRI